MKNEFFLAFNELIEERGLSRDVILTALEHAMVTAYQRTVGASKNQRVEAKVDAESGKITILAEKEVVDDVMNETTEVVLEEARRFDPECDYGDLVMVESTPKNFGRVAAQTARQVIQQRMREAERDEQMEYFQDQVGEIVSGVVQASNAAGLTIGLEKQAEGILSRRDQIPGERFRLHDRVRALIAEVRDHPKGPQIILSRTHSGFLRRLLENEVPEIYHGIVEVRSIAREPGHRAKVAVQATQPGIDPVGACVGMRGVRIQAIVRELHNEKIDVIEWNEDPREFIAKAISPAKVVGVYLEENKNERSRTATVVVKEDQLSLAIGRDGQNARLAARLTGWRIDIKSLSEATADVLYRLQQEELFASIRETEGERVEEIEEIMAKVAENRPLVSDDYAQMMRFVDRVENAMYSMLNPKYTPEQQAHLAEIRESIPAELFEQNILDSELPEHVQYMLQEAGFSNTGDLLIKVLFDVNELKKIKGVGPRAIKSMEKLAKSYMPQPEPEAVEVVAEEVEAAEEPVVEAQVVEEVAAEAAEPQVEEPQAEEILEEPSADEPAEEEVEADVVVEEKPVLKGKPLQQAEPEEEEEGSFEELFEMDLGNFKFVAPTEETDEDDSSKKKKKGRRNVQVEIDPETGEKFSRRRHRKGDEDWDEWGNWG
ncbi:MAG: transcription termination factor NusA [Anaerolineae bacterium]|jgi:N utilization substance protein A|nr:transcription termination factor NusA [Anaerolineae bacterium]